MTEQHTPEFEAFCDEHGFDYTSACPEDQQEVNAAWITWQRFSADHSNGAIIDCDLDMGRAVAKCTKTAMLDSSADDSRISWKRVPTEPTTAMLDTAVAFALNVSVSGEYNWSAYMRDVWLKMLNSSPSSVAKERT